MTPLLSRQALTEVRQTNQARRLAMHEAPADIEEAQFHERSQPSDVTADHHASVVELKPE